FKELKTAAAAQPGDDANITALKAEAQKAIQDGELDKAKQILAKVEKIQDEALDRLALNAAPTAAQLGDRALSPFGRAPAPERFSARLGQVPDGSRQCALKPRREGERDNAAGGGRFRLSRSLAGI